MEEHRIEGLWDCVYCDRKAIKARFAECPFCGKSRGVETQFYLPTDLAAATLSEEEKAKTTNLPDWLCSYCGSYNRSDVACCSKCAASKETSVKNYGFIQKITSGFFRKKD